MSHDCHNESRGLEAPGLTEEQAEWVRAVAASGPHQLQVNPVDPNVFLTLHIDVETAEALSLALAKASGDVAGGLREIVDDWLAVAARSREDPAI